MLKRDTEGEVVRGGQSQQPAVSDLAMQSCPYLEEDRQRCQISTAGQSRVAGAVRACLSDDFDGCPIFLAHLLRRSRPLRCDNDWLDAC